MLRPLVLFFLPVDLRGTEHLEGGEPVLLCANHSSAWDPILFVLSMPQRFNVRIMAKKQLFSIPIVGGFLRAIGVFPVDRGNSDIGAVKTAIQSLRDGWNLFLFPEGTRVKTPGQADVKSGAGMMAIRAGVKLAPVYIGTKKRIFRKTPIIIGEPFEPEYTGRKGTAEEYTANAHEVMRQMAEQIIRNKDENFSNARLIRKVFERTRMKQAMRTSDNMISAEDIQAVFAESDMRALLDSVQVQRRIGFVG